MQAGSISRLYALRTIYVGALVACTILALTPSLLLFPQPASDDYRIALLALIVMIGLSWSYARPDARSKLLTWAVTGAGVTVAAFLVVKLLPIETRLKIPTPDVLPRLLGVDGELADDTFAYEVFNEIWLVLAAIAVTIRLVSAKLQNVRLAKRS